MQPAVRLLEITGGLPSHSLTHSCVLPLFGFIQALLLGLKYLHSHIAGLLSSALHHYEEPQNLLKCLV